MDMRKQYIGRLFPLNDVHCMPFCRCCLSLYSQSRLVHVLSYLSLAANPCLRHGQLNALARKAQSA
jgi:hypothetical protein